MSAQLAGSASLAVRSLVSGPRRRGRMIAAFPAAVYVELPAPGPEPCILALVTPAAVALPIAVIVWRPAGRGAARGSLQQPQAGETGCLAGLTAGDDAVVGGGVIETGLLRVTVCRWWDPAPVLAPLSRLRLQAGARRCRRSALPRRGSRAWTPAPGRPSSRPAAPRGTCRGQPGPPGACSASGRA